MPPTITIVAESTSEVIGGKATNVVVESVGAVAPDVDGSVASAVVSSGWTFELHAAVARAIPAKTRIVLFIIKLYVPVRTPATRRVY